MTKKKTSQEKRNKSGMISVSQDVALNKRARFEYEILETFEAGIMLVGTEVKSLRLGQASINESYVGPRGGEIFAFNINIPEYGQAGEKGQHEPKRFRKLLLHKREVHKLMGAVNKEGLTIIPLSLYFDKKGLAKLKIGLARGKKLHDKREVQKKRDWSRDKARILKAKN